MALIIAAALIMGLTGLAVLLWSIRSGQYDDLEGAAARILLDDSGSIAEETNEVPRPTGDISGSSRSQKFLNVVRRRSEP